MESDELKLRAVRAAECYQGQREAVHGVHARVGYSLSVEMGHPCVQKIHGWHQERQVVQAGAG
jgi:hypothetical protein